MKIKHYQNLLLYGSAYHIVIHIVLLYPSISPTNSFYHKTNNMKIQYCVAFEHLNICN